MTINKVGKVFELCFVANGWKRAVEFKDWCEFPKALDVARSYGLKM